MIDISDDVMNTMKSNNYRQAAKDLPNKLLILLDDSEIVKSHGCKLEDLCTVRTASTIKETLFPEIMFVKRQDSDRRLGRCPDPPGLHHPW